MSDFDLDLRNVEEHLDDEGDGEETDPGFGTVELGVLDGTTDPAEWVTAVDEGSVLVLNVQGDVNKRAAGFARDVKELGGELVHFRGFLIVTPPGISVDTDRL